ncbi:hypothetical protein GOBAR_DD08741 [Gossypium barbadense]|nr:hypothetical protein GOBAR_DD08741 [Gossypium barbadense]
MATVTPNPTPTKTPIDKSRGSHSHHQADDSSSSRSRFEAYNRLQAMAMAFGEKLSIPEIVAIGGQSDGKSSLLEALLGFRFNVREIEMGTRRSLILQMVHDPSTLKPRCRFQVVFTFGVGEIVVAVFKGFTWVGALFKELIWGVVCMLLFEAPPPRSLLGDALWLAT